MKLTAAQIGKLMEVVVNDGVTEVHVEEDKAGKLRFYEVRLVEKQVPIRMTAPVKN